MNTVRWRLPFARICAFVSLGLIPCLGTGCRSRSYGNEALVSSANLVAPSDPAARATVLVTARGPNRDEATICTAAILDKIALGVPARCIAGATEVEIHFASNRTLDEGRRDSESVKSSQIVFPPRVIADEVSSSIEAMAVILLTRSIPPGFLPVPIAATWPTGTGDSLRVVGFTAEGQRHAAFIQGFSQGSGQNKSSVRLRYPDATDLCRGDSASPIFSEGRFGLSLVGFARHGECLAGPDAADVTSLPRETWFVDLLASLTVPELID